MVRTKKPVKLGCLSRSLDKFLDMSDEERKKKAIKPYDSMCKIHMFFFSFSEFIHGFSKPT